MTEQLRHRIHKIHGGGYRLCFQSFGEALNNAGNMGVFCQSEDEFARWTEERRKITKVSDNPNQKYFELINPIVCEAESSTPEARYTHLYIRRHDPDEQHIGDIDFYLDDDEFEDLKQRLRSGEPITGARIYDRQDLDMVELYDESSDVLAYVSTKKMTERARVKQSEETKL